MADDLKFETRGNVGHEKPRRARARRGDWWFARTRLLFLDDLAHGIHRFADAAADTALGFLDLALGLKMAIASHLAGLFLDRAGRLLQAALYPLPIHRIPLGAYFPS